MVCIIKHIVYRRVVVKVIRREPKVFEAYQWTGNGWEDFRRFKAESGIEDAVMNVVYSKSANVIYMDYEEIFQGVPIYSNQYLVYDEGISILTEKEFKEIYMEQQ